MSMSNATGPAPFHIFPAFRGCKRPYALAIIIFVVMLTMLEYAAGSDQSMANLMFACVLASMSIGMYWLPACCGIGITALSVATTLYPGMPFSPQLWSLWLVFGMLAHQRRYVLVSMLFIAEIAAYLAALVFHVPTWTPSGIVTLLGTFVIAAIAGYGISALQQFQRIQEELRQRQSLQERYHRSQRDLLLASRIHDSTARGLTLISLMADDSMPATATGENSHACLHDIKSVAADTLAETRTVIDILCGSDDSAAYVNRDHDNVMFVDALRQQMDGYDHLLATLGFLGTSVVHTEKQGTNYRPDSAVAEELRDLIDQLYTNIVTHARQGNDSYVIRIVVGRSRINLTESNTCDVARSSDRHISHGLSLHERRIRALGGTMTYAIEDDVWTLRAQIPLLYA